MVLVVESCGVNVNLVVVIGGSECSVVASSTFFGIVVLCQVVVARS